MPVEQDIRADTTRMAMAADDLRSVLTHLITNAIEASGEGDVVKVRLWLSDGRVILDVEDRGGGMDSTFIRKELFAPLRSTRSHGHGIGAFQARELVRSAGGDLEVISAVGEGTIMRIVMPTPPSIEPKGAVAIHA
jgi:signal transduction histidine kinase